MAKEHKLLRKRIRELERQAEKTIEVPVMDKVAMQNLKKTSKVLGEVSQKIAEAVAGLDATIRQLEDEIISFSIRSGVPSPRDRVSFRASASILRDDDE